MHELECYRALADSLPGERFRYDPNSALSLADAIAFGSRILDIRNDYFEDPVWGMPQLKRLKDFVSLPIATNTVVVNFEQLATNIQNGAVDVILLDTTFWGGIRPASRRRASARRWGWALPFTAPESSASNSRRCCTWARSCPTSATRRTRTTITSSTT
jgi:L-alanine-DL-glutamate epimerase-like enolase superfamily enzyme